MYDSNKTWFCKGFETSKAKEIRDKLNKAILEGNHAESTELFNQVKKIMRKRIDENYFSPIKSINLKLREQGVPENTAFITMGICCILIELYYELINGYDESKEGGPVANAYKTVLPLIDSSINEDLCLKYYKGLRCGIIHQGQTKENTALSYKLETVIEENGPYYLCNPDTVFYGLKELYRNYWVRISERKYSDIEGKNLIAKFEKILSHIE